MRLHLRKRSSHSISVCEPSQNIEIGPVSLYENGLQWGGSCIIIIY